MIAGVLVEARPASACAGYIPPVDLHTDGFVLGISPAGAVSIKPRITIARIQEVVAAYYGLEPDDLAGQSRKWDVAHPRQVAMYLAREQTGQSLPCIGKRFGGRDHSTVIHAVREVRKRMSADNAVFRDVQRLAGFLS